jgi:hypothetical protein
MTLYWPGFWSDWVEHSNFLELLENGLFKNVAWEKFLVSGHEIWGNGIIHPNFNNLEAQKKTWLREVRGVCFVHFL